MGVFTLPWPLTVLSISQHHFAHPNQLHQRDAGGTLVSTTSALNTGTRVVSLDHRRAAGPRGQGNPRGYQVDGAYVDAPPTADACRFAER